MELNKKEIETLLKCIDTEIGWTCKIISARNNVIKNSENKEYKEYLENLTLKDKEFMLELTKLEKKLKGE